MQQVMLSSTDLPAHTERSSTDPGAWFLCSSLRQRQEQQLVDSVVSWKNPKFELQTAGLPSPRSCVLLFLDVLRLLLLQWPIPHTHFTMCFVFSHYSFRAPPWRMPICGQPQPLWEPARARGARRTESKRCGGEGDDS